MLQFYYDFLCKFLDPMVFQLLEMDTDSMDGTDWEIGGVDDQA